jgi:hypothetical protein
MSTTYMNLDLPVVLSTLGPAWATQLNTALTTIDSHDHSTSHGVKITPSGLNINAALSFGNNVASNVQALTFYSQPAALTTYKESIQSVGGSLFYINAAGVAVQITSGSAVNASVSSSWGVKVPVSYPYTVVSGDFQKMIAVDTTSARTINLPAATTTMYVHIKDISGSAATNNITITPSGSDSIEGAVSSYLVDANYASVNLISDGISAWYVV